MINIFQIKNKFVDGTVITGSKINKITFSFCQITRAYPNNVFNSLSKLSCKYCNLFSAVAEDLHKNCIKLSGFTFTCCCKLKPLLSASKTGVRTGCLKGGAVAYQYGSVIFGDTCKNVLLFAKLYEKGNQIKCKSVLHQFANVTCLTNIVVKISMNSFSLHMQVG